MVAVSSDVPDDDAPSWNVEGDNLAFLRDEGLELLSLFRSIKDEKKRKLVLDLIRVVAGDQR